MSVRVYLTFKELQEAKKSKSQKQKVYHIFTDQDLQQRDLEMMRKGWKASRKPKYFMPVTAFVYETLEEFIEREKE